jgi:hypothetical protein
LLQRTGAFDFEGAGGNLGRDAFGGERLLARDAGGLGRLRAAISACSRLRVRSISSRRFSSSWAMRAVLTASSCAMRAFSVSSRAVISAFSTLRCRSISRR